MSGYQLHPYYAPNRVNSTQMGERMDEIGLDGFGLTLFQFPAHSRDCPVRLRNSVPHPEQIRYSDRRGCILIPIRIIQIGSERQTTSELTLHRSPFAPL